MPEFLIVLYALPLLSAIIGLPVLVSVFHILAQTFDSDSTVNISIALSYPFSPKSLLNILCLPVLFASLISLLVAFTVGAIIWCRDGAIEIVKDFYQFEWLLLVPSVSLVLIGLGFGWRLIGHLHQFGYDAPAPPWGLSTVAFCIFRGSLVLLTILVLLASAVHPGELVVLPGSLEGGVSTGFRMRGVSLPTQADGALHGKVAEAEIIESGPSDYLTILEADEQPCTQEAPRLRSPEKQAERIDLLVYFAIRFALMLSLAPLLTAAAVRSSNNLFALLDLSATCKLAKKYYLRSLASLFFSVGLVVLAGFGIGSVLAALFFLTPTGLGQGKLF